MDKIPMVKGRSLPLIGKYFSRPKSTSQKLAGRTRAIFDNAHRAIDHSIKPVITAAAGHAEQVAETASHIGTQALHMLRDEVPEQAHMLREVAQQVSGKATAKIANFSHDVQSALGDGKKVDLHRLQGIKKRSLVPKKRSSWLACSRTTAVVVAATGLGIVVLARIPKVRHKILIGVNSVSPKAAEKLHKVSRKVRNVVGSVWLEDLEESGNLPVK